MNRLIIIGNGFDLAHGLKTSYCDFLDDYLKNALDTFYEKDHYDDPLLNLENSAVQISYQYPYTSPVDVHCVHKHLADMRSSEFFVVTFKSGLLERSVQKSHEIRWVDLENDFFDELLSCLDKTKKIINHAALATLNNQFGFLKNKLEEYLLKVQIDEKTFKPDRLIQKIFREKIDSKDILIKKVSSPTLRKIMFLNFNYTNTLSKYAERQVYDETNGQYMIYKDTINHIHGTLASDDNKIVFGFGDEYDEEYLKFENLKNNDLFRHIKSFAYFKTRNYHDLIRFLNDAEFQVFIIGHSCGLSDRTMFRKIFEHSNCLSIKVFFHKKQDNSTDYVDKTYELSRHFTNKGEMREKIVVEPNSSPLPQYMTEQSKKSTVK